MRKEAIEKGKGKGMVSWGNRCWVCFPKHEIIGCDTGTLTMTLTTATTVAMNKQYTNHIILRCPSFQKANTFCQKVKGGNILFKPCPRAPIMGINLHAYESKKRLEACPS